MSVNSKWHNLSVHQILENLNIDVDGLSESEAKERLEKYGLNKIGKEKQRLPFFTLIKQLKE